MERSQGTDLGGLSVVVTRASHQATSLIGLLADRGARVAHVATIEVQTLDAGGPGELALLAVEGYSWIAFTSSNAVTVVAEEATRLGVLDLVVGRQLAAVGSATALAVSTHLRAPDLVAPVESAAELALAFPQPRSGDSCLFPTALEGRLDLVEGLESRGWKVDRVGVYRTVHPRLDDAQRAELENADCVTFASPSAVRGVVDAGVVLSAQIVCIGEVTAEASRAAGFVPTAVALTANAQGLVDAVGEVFGDRAEVDGESL
jgi:uroporphyrinogen III methyltransferase/synthase